MICLSVVSIFRIAFIVIVFHSFLFTLQLECIGLVNCFKQFPKHIHESAHAKLIRRVFLLHKLLLQVSEYCLSTK